MFSTLNVVRIEANRRNARQSTGPRTEIGKTTSSLNALRHGLTSASWSCLTTGAGGWITLSSIRSAFGCANGQDLAAYQQFSEEFLVALAPETFAERQYAQTIIDTQWRLNRVRALEDCVLALGHYGPESQIDAAHPEIHAALTAAAVFRAHSQAFVNLSMHEQRLYRILTAASKSLEDLKAQRIAARQAALDGARENTT